jgi:hypothetical protein
MAQYRYQEPSLHLVGKRIDIIGLYRRRGLLLLEFGRVPMGVSG